MDENSDSAENMVTTMYNELKGYNMAQMFSLSSNNQKANKADATFNDK